MIYLLWGEYWGTIYAWRVFKLVKKLVMCHSRFKRILIIHLFYFPISISKPTICKLFGLNYWLKMDLWINIKLRTKNLLSLLLKGGKANFSIFNCRLVSISFNFTLFWVHCGYFEYKK